MKFILTTLVTLGLSAHSFAQGTYNESFTHYSDEKAKTLKNLVELNGQNGFPVNELIQTAGYQDCSDGVIYEGLGYYKNINAASEGLVAVLFENSSSPVFNKFIRGTLWTSPLLEGASNRSYDICEDSALGTISLFDYGVAVKVVELKYSENISAEQLKKYSTISNPAVCFYSGKELSEKKNIKPLLCLDGSTIQDWSDFVEVRAEGYRYISDIASKMELKN